MVTGPFFVLLVKKSRYKYKMVSETLFKKNNPYCLISTIVTPSPPSPYTPSLDVLTCLWLLR